LKFLHWLDLIARGLGYPVWLSKAHLALWSKDQRDPRHKQEG
jgi:hypothetical protein